MRHKKCLGRIDELQGPKGCGENARDHGNEHHDRHGTAKTWSHAPTLSRPVYPDHVSDAHPEINSDSTAILPVRVGTGIAVVSLIYCSVTQPISPSDAEGVWWFGVALIASISGVLGLVFLEWRKNRMLRRNR